MLTLYSKSLNQNTMSKFQDIKKLIPKNNLKEVIDIILEIANELNYEKYYSEAILYSSRYTGNENNYLGSLINYERYKRERAMITLWANGFLDKAEEELEDDFYQDIIFKKSEYNSYEDFKNRYLDKLDIPNSVVDKKIKNSGTKGKAKILFLSANPTDSARLQVDKEFRTIKGRLHRNEYYDLLNPELALTVQDMIIAVKQKPQIVHFAGHGKRNAIIISDGKNQQEVEMSTNALKRLFRKYKNSLLLILLNACYSAKQAKALSELGFYVIGMNNLVKDSASIDFAEGLYIGLSEGGSVEDAFDDAMVMMETKHSTSADLPEIWKDGKKLEL